MVCKEASLVSPQIVLPSADSLQSWANTPEEARIKLRSLFSSLNAAEALAGWATEALENCGQPFESDIPFLSEATESEEGDIAYWACKLLGRLGGKANAAQVALASALLADNTPSSARHQAAIAIGLIGTLNTTTREALQKASKSADARLAKLAIQSLDTT